ncbi:MAG: sugar kinase [Paracoccaceae bacterium]
MPQPDIVCLGEAMIELSLTGQPPGPGQVSFAGDTFNTAVYCKRAAPELTVSFATKVGRDLFSDALLAFMEEERLDTSLVSRSDDRTPGLYAISTDAAGERSFTYWRDQSAARLVLEQPGLDLGSLNCGYFFFSAISLAILPDTYRTALMNWLPDYRRSGGQVVFDSNYRPALWPDVMAARKEVEACWRLTDVALPSKDDETALAGDNSATETRERLRGLGVTQGVVKRGPEGPLSFDPSVEMTFSAVPNVVDTTAAGDSFNGAYLAALMQGRDQRAAMQAGHDLASRVVGQRGAIIPKDAMMEVS